MAEAAPSPEALKRGHETRDVNAQAIAWTGIGVVIAIAFSALIAYACIVLSTANTRALTVSERPPSSVAGEPPPGELPGTPIEDPEVLTARKEAMLHGYRWMNKKAGIVSIPIERAMHMIADTGLPDFDRRAIDRAPQ